MKPIFNRAPLTPNTLTPLPLGSIRPEDWLLEQLQAQRDGLTEALAAWEAVGRDSGWLGGPGESGALTPCYLEGLVAMAWTLDDGALKARAMEYIEWILQSQREDGWFGPEANDDYWPLVAALKALRLYFTASNDRRVLVLMDRFFKYQVQNLTVHPMKEWAVARGGDNMALALWLYNLTGQKHLIDLCRRLRAQTLDWPNYFHTFANTVPMSKSLNWSRLNEALAEEKDEPLMGERRPYFHTQYHLSHGVNIAMGLKTPGVINLFKSGFKEEGGFRFGWNKLVRHHGVASGMFICDGHLNGNSPTQGSDLNAVVELMASLEALLGLGEFNQELADALEKLAYNALPAAFTADMAAHQCLEQVNQVEVSRQSRKWYNGGDGANLYAPRGEDDACAANCGKGWPGFAASLWYATDDGGLHAVSYAPCTVRATLGGVPARLRVSGGYPFGQSVEIRVDVKQPGEFPLYLRMPFWARQPMVFLPGGEIMQVRSGEVTCVRRRWRSGDVIRLELGTIPRVSKWYHQSGTVEHGPLLMALQPLEQWQTLEDGSHQATAGSPWNYALVRDEPMKAVYEGEIHAFGVGPAPVKVLARAVPVDWPMDGGSCASVPMMPHIRLSDARVIELVPFGGTGLRIGQFPLGRAVVSPEKEDEGANV
ncbi:MAG: glycoside hydrolase family 127 protein [Clostridia bacterium]|nr:glycoside hydrolase family 127 protein [Clostridia bacterium]